MRLNRNIVFQFATICGIDLAVAIGLATTLLAQTPTTGNAADAVHQIVLMPVIDARGHKKVKINLSEMRDYARKKLEAKQYVVSESEVALDFGGNAPDSVLTDARPEWVRRQGPPDSRFLMVIVLNDAHKARALAAKSSANGYLYDKMTGNMLWHATDFYHEWGSKAGKLTVTPFEAFRLGKVIRVSFEDAISRLIDDHDMPH